MEASVKKVKRSCQEVATDRQGIWVEEADGVSYRSCTFSSMAITPEFLCGVKCRLVRGGVPYLGCIINCMATISNTSPLYGATGVVGGLLLRNINGKTVVSMYVPPKKRKNISALQQLTRNRFAEASQKAKALLRDFEVYTYYKAKAKKLGVGSAYTAAVTDIMRKVKEDQYEPSFAEAAGAGEPSFVEAATAGATWERKDVVEEREVFDLQDKGPSASAGVMFRRGASVPKYYDTKNVSMCRGPVTTLAKHSMNTLLRDFSQNNRLPIRMVAPGFGHLPTKAAGEYGRMQRLPYYFFLFMLDGSSEYRVDLDRVAIGNNDLLFSVPHQIQEWPTTSHGNRYYKLGFDEECLAKLPRQYSFLLNPLNQQKISFSASGALRLQVIFAILQELLRTPETDPELILAHLNSLLTEINIAYFAIDGKPVDNRLGKYIGFKLLVESNLTDHPTVADMARKLATNTDSLNLIVKQYSGLSPKEFMNRRLILEARRRLHYGERFSVKELAFDLGFNDPDYFSRLFKKVTGKTVACFYKDLS